MYLCPKVTRRCNLPIETCTDLPGSVSCADDGDPASAVLSHSGTRQITMASCNKSLQKSPRGWEFWWRHDVTDDVTHAPPEPIGLG